MAMLHRKMYFFLPIWLVILILGRNEIITYSHYLTGQEPIIRSYIDSCVLDFPFSFCRLIYNKLTFAFPQRVISLLVPLSVENIFLHGKSAFMFIFFPAYLVGTFALFLRFYKYSLLTCIIFTALLLNLLLQRDFFINYLSLPIIFFIVISEIYSFVKK